MLHQPDPSPCLPQLTGLAGGLAGLGALSDVGLTHPLVQRHREHTEVGGDRLGRHTVFTIAGHAHDIVAKLLGG